VEGQAHEFIFEEEKKGSRRNTGKAKKFKQDRTLPGPQRAWEPDWWSKECKDSKKKKHEPLSLPDCNGHMGKGFQPYYLGENGNG